MNSNVSDVLESVRECNMKKRFVLYYVATLILFEMFIKFWYFCWLSMGL